MNIKELKQLIENLPDNLTVLLNFEGYLATIDLGTPIRIGDAVIMNVKDHGLDVVIPTFLSEYCTEVYDMPLSDLELKMDNHKVVEYNDKQYFIPEDLSGLSYQEEIIMDFLLENHSV